MERNQNNIAAVTHVLHHALRVRVEGGGEVGGVCLQEALTPDRVFRVVLVDAPVSFTFLCFSTPRPSTGQCALEDGFLSPIHAGCHKKTAGDQQYGGMETVPSVRGAVIRFVRLQELLVTEWLR